MKVIKRDDSPYFLTDFMFDGKRIRKSTGEKTRAKALKVANQILIDMDIKNSSMEEIELGEAARRTVESVERRTKESYELCRRKLFGLEGKVYGLSPTLLLSELSTKHINDYVMHRKREGLKNTSINIELRFIRRMVNLHKKCYNTNARFEITELKARPKSRYLNFEEQASVLELLHAKSNTSSYLKAYQLCMFLLDTGARINEALELRWVDIDLETRSVRLYRSKVHSWSVLPLSDRVVDFLIENRSNERPFVGMTRAIKCLRSAIDQVANVDQLIVETKGKATIHTLRDSFGASMTIAQMPTFALQQVMGHSDITTTQKYVRLTESDSADLARQALVKLGRKNN